MATPSHPAADHRQARLDARLALYAQYASLVGDEVAAAWSEDPLRAGSMTREIARARAALAEHYEELRQSSAEGLGAVAPDAFGQLLDEAVTELDHQQAVERSLRTQLEAQLERLRGPLALPPGAEPIPEPAAPAAQAASGPADESALDARATARETADAEEADDAPFDAPPFGAAQLAARAGGIAGVLGGQFPGITAGADSTVYVAPTGDLERPEGAPSRRLDVRF